MCLFNRKQRYNWEDLWYDTIIGGYEQAKEEDGLKKYARFIIFIVVLPFMFITFLLVAPFSTIENIIKKGSKTIRTDEPMEKEDYSIYYWQMGGAGTIICKDCGYKEDIVSFLHSFDGEGNPSDGRWGYQCQSCGRFHTLNDSQRAEKPLICPCGGELSRDKPLFCPQCKSTNLRYKMSYIT